MNFFDKKYGSCNVIIQTENYKYLSRAGNRKKEWTVSKYFNIRTVITVCTQLPALIIIASLFISFYYVYTCTRCFLQLLRVKHRGSIV